MEHHIDKIEEIPEDTDSSTHIHQLFRQAHQHFQQASPDEPFLPSEEHPSQSLPCGSDTATKRDFDLAFPSSPSNRVAGPLYSHFPGHVSRCDNGGGTVDNDGIVTSDTIDNDDGDCVDDKVCNEEQITASRRIAPTEIDARELDRGSHVSHAEGLPIQSQNEMYMHIWAINSNSSSTPIVKVTAKTIVDEILLNADCNLITSKEFLPKCTTPSPPKYPSFPNQLCYFCTNFGLPPKLIAQRCAADSIYETESTETELAVTAADDRPLNITDTNASDELWERELASIRRPLPIVAGDYKIVTLPLRDTDTLLAFAGQRVRASGIDAMGQPSKSGSTSTHLDSNDETHKNIDIIDILDSSDEENKRPSVRSSSLVGGGDRLYTVGGTQINSEGDIVSDWSLQHEHQPCIDIDSSYGLPVYEGVNECENYHGEDVKYFDLSTDPARYIYEDKFDDHHSADHMKEKDTTSTSIRNGVIGASRSRNQDRTVEHDHVIGTHTKRYAGRNRSRSPDRLPNRALERTSYRQSRDRPRKYMENGSVLQVRHGGSYAGDSSAGARRENPYKRVTQRYMRDEPESPSFYGVSPNVRLKGGSAKMLRYQDRLNNVGEVPGPKSGLRLKLDDYIRDVGINEDQAGLEWDIKHVLKETFYAGETLDEEQAMRHSWTKSDTRLYKGFPLVEKIGFVTVGNHARPEGDCYWRALAYNLYGSPARWDIVKAEHLVYLLHVLGDRTHPRHELYEQLNTMFIETSGPTASSPHRFKANIWQLLHMPHSWTPGIMQQVTADLYGIYLITFAYNTQRNVCSEVSIRGAYNSRHVFMLFVDSCHFQPLTVNEYLS